MADIKATTVMQLRKRTGAPMMACKKALIESDGDMDAAIKYLQERMQGVANKKAGREASEGTIATYVHSNGKMGAMVELNCETDFAAKNEQFTQLAYDLAVQVAAGKPLYVSPDDIPEADLNAQRELFSGQAEHSGKPPKVVEKIIEGRLRKWFLDVCLMDQPWFKDDEKTVREILTTAIGTIGENIKVGRIVLWEIGK